MTDPEKSEEAIHGFHSLNQQNGTAKQWNLNEESKKGSNSDK